MDRWMAVLVLVVTPMDESEVGPAMLPMDLAIGQRPPGFVRTRV